MEGLELLEEWRRAGQLALLCPLRQACPAETAGLLTCYDWRQHSLRFFGGRRERVVRRDRFRCQGCGAQSPLVVHHRSEENEDEALITLCIRCHVRVHRWRCLHHWVPGVLMKLWSELHADAPVQLQLQLSPVIRMANNWSKMTEGKSVPGPEASSYIRFEQGSIADLKRPPIG